MLGKGLDGLSQFLFQVANVGTALVLIVVFGNVLMRCLFNEPLYWSEEVTATTLILMTMFPAALLWRRDWHIRLDALSGYQGTRLYQWKTLVITLAAILLTGVLTWQAASATYLVWAQDMREPSLLGSPFWVSYSFLLIGTGTLCLACLASLLETIGRLRS